MDLRGYLSFVDPYRQRERRKHDRPRHPRPIDVHRVCDHSSKRNVTDGVPERY